MLANFFETVQAAQLTKELQQLEYQVQVRHQVINQAGQILTPVLNDWQLTDHPSVQIDAASDQVILTTKFHPQIDGVLDELTLLADAVETSLDANQLTWPYAMPSRLTNPAHLALAQTAPTQLINRAAVSIKFNPLLLMQLYTRAYHTEYADQASFNAAVVQKVSDRLHMYQWFITYMFGNSPFVPEGFGATNEIGCRSIAGTLWHLQQRPAFTLTHDERGLANGITFENIELDGQSLTGVASTTLDFLALFTLFCLTLPNDDPSADELAGAQELNAYVASEEAAAPTLAQEGAAAILNAVTRFATDLNFNTRSTTVLNLLRSRIEDAHQTPAAELAKQGFNGSILSYGRQQADDLKAAWLADNALLPSLADLVPLQQATVYNLIKAGEPFELMPSHTLVYDGGMYPASVSWPECENNR